MKNATAVFIAILFSFQSPTAFATPREEIEELREALIERFETEKNFVAEGSGEWVLLDQGIEKVQGASAGEMNEYAMALAQHAEVANTSWYDDFMSDDGNALSVIVRLSIMVGAGYLALSMIFGAWLPL